MINNSKKVLIVLFVPTCLLLGKFFYAVSTIRKFDIRYQTVVLGEDYSDVLRTLGPPNYLRLSNALKPFEPDQNLSELKGEIVIGYEYATFFLPMRYELTLDESLHVNKKQILD